jgi:hypothetical protein
MQRSTLINGSIAFLIGFIVMFADVWLIGLHAYYYSRGPGLHDLLGLSFYVEELVVSIVWLWSLTALLGACLLALLKPRRWALYSLCAMAPSLLEAAWGAIRVSQYGVPVGYQLLSEMVRLCLMPVFLAFIYAIVRRHAPATP